MPDNALTHLKENIERVIILNRKLHDANELLRINEAQWKTERSQLIQQGDIARRKVNEMIERLQTLERNSG
jgi:cell division protein ZapB